jgi:hypothetical protein
MNQDELIRVRKELLKKQIQIDAKKAEIVNEKYQEINNISQLTRIETPITNSIKTSDIVSNSNNPLVSIENIKDELKFKMRDVLNETQFKELLKELTDDDIRVVNSKYEEFLSDVKKRKTKLDLKSFLTLMKKFTNTGNVITISDETIRKINPLYEKQNQDSEELQYIKSVLVNYPSIIKMKRNDIAIEIGKIINNACNY